MQEMLWKSKPFIYEYNQKGINYHPRKNDWKSCEKNNPGIASYVTK